MAAVVLSTTATEPQEPVAQVAVGLAQTHQQMEQVAQPTLVAVAVAALVLVEAMVGQAAPVL